MTSRSVEQTNMFRKLHVSILVAAAVLMFCSAAVAQSTFSGQIVDVIDGKTVVVAIPSGKITVELQYIDVPMAGQDLHDTVRDHLRSLVFGAQAEYKPRTIMRDRTVGRLMVNNIDVSQQMLRDGAGWHIPAQASGQDAGEFETYRSTEAIAKSEKRGVWSIPGLKPAWEVRAADREAERQDQNKFVSARSAETSASRKTRLSKNVNPALGDIGALANYYDPVTKRGYIGTSFLDIRELADAVPGEFRTLIDASYIYKEDEKKIRKGSFVISILSIAKKWRFLDHNDLVMVSEDKNFVIGKPKRTTSTNGDMLREKLSYEVSRTVVERFVNGNEVYLKLGSYMIKPTPGLQYLLNNLLQVTR